MTIGDRVVFIAYGCCRADSLSSTTVALQCGLTRQFSLKKVTCPRSRSRVLKTALCYTTTLRYTTPQTARLRTLVDILTDFVVYTLVSQLDTHYLVWKT